jgi:hypothetical protein
MAECPFDLPVGSFAIIRCWCNVSAISTGFKADSSILFSNPTFAWSVLNKDSHRGSFRVSHFLSLPCTRRSFIVWTVLETLTGSIRVIAIFVFFFVVLLFRSFFLSDLDRT